MRLISLVGTVAVLLLGGSAVLTAQTDTTKPKYPKFVLGLDAVSVWQALEQGNDAGTLPNLTSGFQAAVGNARLKAQLADSIDMYVELYLSSKHHAGEVTDREGWVRIGRLPDSWDFLGLNRVFDLVDVKAGHFEVDFGDQHLVRSDNADVQRNPLVGNYLIDPNTVESGIEVLTRTGPLRWVVGVGGGVTVEDFQPGRGYSVHGKVSLVDPREQYRLSASLYRVDHSGNPTGFPNNGTFGELFSGNRSGSRYSGVITGGPDAGQLNLGRGQDELDWQFDGMVNLHPIRLSGLYGRADDKDINGSDPGTPRETWSYYGVEAKLDLAFDMLYLVGRYSGAQTKMFRGNPADARVDRFQVGGGMRIYEQMLVKVEYVRQNYHDFTAAFAGSPRFYGVLVETSISF